MPFETDLEKDRMLFVNSAENEALKSRLHCDFLLNDVNDWISHGSLLWLQALRRLTTNPQFYIYQKLKIAAKIVNGSLNKKYAITKESNFQEHFPSFI